MADILEYLDWRGDIPFDVDPFNDVDNLILAQIAYTDFEGVMTQDEELPIEEAAGLYFNIHTEEEVMARDTFFKCAPLVLRKASECRRFQGTTVGRYINMISPDREEQYSAVTYRLPDGVCYVAFRGTDNTIVGWKEDFNLTFMNETAGQRRAVEYVNYYFKDTDERLILGGHSKGGNFAVYAGAFCEQNVQNRIINVYSNDGPGFRDEILARDGYKRILPRVVSILPEETIVGVLLSNEYENHIVKSSAKGINQHDPMTWQVYGNGFVEEEHRSESSHLIDKTMMKWLATMNDEDRAAFTDSLFSTIESTGVTTLHEVSEGGLKTIAELMKSLKNMAPERQQEFSASVKRLLKIGSELAVKDVKSKARLPKIERMVDRKTELRKTMKDIRGSLTETELAEYSHSICETVRGLRAYEEADIVLAYMSIGSEVRVQELINSARADGKRVYIPKVISKKEMRFYLYDGKFTKGSFGIKEPKNTSDMKMYDAELEHLLGENRRTLVIVPALAFDIEKNRLGYGGGYYDRFFEKVEGYPVSFVAVGFDCQIIDSIPTEPNDKKPEMIVTENRIIT